MPGPRSANTGFLTAKQRRFVEEYAKDVDGGKAAARAGYKNPEPTARQLLSDAYPHVAHECRKIREHRMLTAVMTGDELLRQICAGVRFNPTRYFETGESRKGVPGWLMSEQQLRDLPPEVGALIEETEYRAIDKADGTSIRKVWVRFASKLGLIGLAAKQLLGERLTVEHTFFDRITDAVDVSEAERDKVGELVAIPLKLEQLPPQKVQSQAKGLPDYPHSRNEDKPCQS